MRVRGTNYLTAYNLNHFPRKQIPKLGSKIPKSGSYGNFLDNSAEGEAGLKWVGQVKVCLGESEKISLAEVEVAVS